MTTTMVAQYTQISRNTFILSSILRVHRVTATEITVSPKAYLLPDLLLNSTPPLLTKLPWTEKAFRHVCLQRYIPA
jgi:hypothetical protein